MGFDPASARARALALLWLAGALAAAAGAGWAHAETRWVAAVAMGGLSLLGAWRGLRWFAIDHRRAVNFARAFAAGDGALAKGGGGELGRLLRLGVDRFAGDRREALGEARFLRAILDQLPSPVLGRDAQGAVHGLNAAGRRLLGAAVLSRARAQERLGANLMGQFDGASAEALPVITGGAMRRMRAATARADGERGAFVLLILTDIEAHLERAELRAWRNQARILTHEVMNGLTPVISLAQTAARHAEGDAAEALLRLERRAGTLLGFVRRYREAVQPVRAERRRVLVRDVLEDAAIGDGVQAAIDVDPPELAAEIDPALFGRAIANLVGNARDALADAPEARLFVRASAPEPGQLAVDVADNGPGVDPALGEDVFQPLFTTKRDGLGIGLAIARQAVAAHDGVIDWTPTPGGGVTFRIRCPA